MAKHQQNNYQKKEYTKSSYEAKNDGAEKTAKIVDNAKIEVTDTIKDTPVKEVHHITHPNVEAYPVEDVKHAIESKKAELMEPENKKTTTTIEKTAVTTEKKVKKPRKWDINPFNRARYRGTRFVSDVAAVPLRAHAKVMHIDARPQQLWSKGFWKDLGKNITKIPKNVWTTISGALYKPNRGKAKFEDNFKDYGPTFGPDAKDYKMLKKSSWFAGKFIGPTVSGRILPFPKFFANLERGLSHAFIETAEGVRDSKWYWNPKKWNTKPWNYSKTKESFNKAFGLNKKGVPAHGATAKKETQVMELKHTEITEEKKAA